MKFYLQKNSCIFFKEKLKWIFIILNIYFLFYQNPYNSVLGQCPLDEFDWVDDFEPPGSTEIIREPWSWASSNPLPVSGTRYHKSPNASGFHNHAFVDASLSQKMIIKPNDTLFCWVYINSSFPTKEIMLEWGNNIYGSGGFYRAYWRPAGFTTDTCIVSSPVGKYECTYPYSGYCYYAGVIPSVTGWYKLKVRARDIGITGIYTADAMSFGCVDGEILWDKTGKIVSDGTGAGLKTEFYDNLETGNGTGAYYITSLMGIRTYANWPTNFNWWDTNGGMYGAPDDISGGSSTNSNKLGLSSDGNTWGLRMVGYYKAPSSGTYSFRVSGDDGFVIWVNGAKASSYWLNKGCGYDPPKNTPFLIGGQFYPIIVQYFQNTGSTCFQSLQYNNGSGWNDIPSGSLYTYDFTVPNINGLFASYYDGSSSTTIQPGNGGTWTNDNFYSEGNFANDVFNIPSTACNNESCQGWGWKNNTDARPQASSIPNGTGGSDDYWALKYTGYIKAPQTGTYTFYTYSEDEDLLKINGTTLISDWTGSSTLIENSGTISLTAGQYYSFYQDFGALTGSSNLYVKYECNNCATPIAKTYLPLNLLYLNKTNMTANAGTQQFICFGNTTTLGGSPTANNGTSTYSYSWSASSGIIPLPVANPTVSPTTNTTYTVTLTDACSYTAISSVAVIVNPLPTANAQSSSSSACNGNSVSLSANGSAGTVPYGQDAHVTSLRRFKLTTLTHWLSISKRSQTISAEGGQGIRRIQIPVG